MLKEERKNVMFWMKGKGEEDEGTYMVAVCSNLRILQKPREGIRHERIRFYLAVGDQR